MKTLFFFKLAIYALEVLSKRTDNTIDDQVVETVKNASKNIC